MHCCQLFLLIICVSLFFINQITNLQDTLVSGTSDSTLIIPHPITAPEVPNREDSVQVAKINCNEEFKGGKISEPSQKEIENEFEHSELLQLKSKYADALGTIVSLQDNMNRLNDAIKENASSAMELADSLRLTKIESDTVKEDLKLLQNEHRELQKELHECLIRYETAERFGTKKAAEVEELRHTFDETSTALKVITDENEILAKEREELLQKLHDCETLESNFLRDRQQFIENGNSNEQIISELTNSIKIKDERIGDLENVNCKLSVDLEQLMRDDKKAIGETNSKHSENEQNAFDQNILDALLLLERNNESLLQENAKLIDQFSLRRDSNPGLKKDQSPSAFSVPASYLILTATLIPGLSSCDICNQAESSILQWEQIEASLLDETPLLHLSRYQTVVIVGAVLHLFSMRNDEARHELQMSDDLFFDSVSKCVVSSLGVCADFFCDNDGIPQIPITFIIQVLCSANVAYLLQDSCGYISNALVIPAAFPTGEPAIQLKSRNESLPSVILNFCHPLPNIFFNALILRLSLYLEHKHSYSNIASFYIPWHSNSLRSNVLVVYDRENVSVTLWVSGESHVLAYIVLNSIMTLCGELCSVNQSISYSLSSQYASIPRKNEWFLQSNNYDTIKNIFFIPFWVANDGKFIPSVPFFAIRDIDVERAKSFVTLCVEASVLSKDLVHKSLPNADFHMLDSAIFALHFQLLLYVAVANNGLKNNPVLQNDDVACLATLWLICVRNLGGDDCSGDENPSNVWLIPVSPGSYPTEQWSLLLNAGICIGDILASERISVFDLRLQNDDSFILAALNTLGMSVTPGLTVIGVLKNNLHRSKYEDTIRDRLLEQQYAHFHCVLNCAGFHHWANKSILQKSSNQLLNDCKKGITPAEIDEIDLSALDETFTLDDRAAFTKAKMVGELSRRLTFHREKSRHIDYDGDDGVVASHLRNDPKNTSEPPVLVRRNISCCIPLSFAFLSTEFLLPGQMDQNRYYFCCLQIQDLIYLFFNTGAELRKRCSLNVAKMFN